MCFSILTFSQEKKHYSLDELIRSAYVNYPYARQLHLNRLQVKESIKSVNSIWLPQVTISGKSSYQSEVSAVNIPQSIAQEIGLNVGKGEKLQYQGEVGVSQLIYDGGISKVKKKLAGINGNIQESQIKSLMLQIEENIDNLFESILINREQIKIINFQQKDLELRKKDLSYAIQNGISLKTDLQEIDAGLIQLEQQEISLRMQLCQDFVQLSSFTQQQIDTTVVFDFPQFTCIMNENYINRPDFQIFERQIESSKYELKKINQALVPQMSLFANGYYGRPGINVMDYSTHYSGIIGVSLKWNVSALYNNVHQKKLVNINRYLIKSNQLIYEIDLSNQIDKLKNNLIKNKDLMNSDDNIVEIRSSVKNVAATQLKNGSITLTDYLIKLNDVSKAMINRSIHKIEFLMDNAKMRTLLNENN